MNSRISLVVQSTTSLSAEKLRFKKIKNDEVRSAYNSRDEGAKSGFKSNMELLPLLWEVNAWQQKRVSEIMS